MGYGVLLHAQNTTPQERYPTFLSASWAHARNPSPPTRGRTDHFSTTNSTNEQKIRHVV